MMISFFPELISDHGPYHMDHMAFGAYNKDLLWYACKIWGHFQNAPRKLRHREDYIFEIFKIFKEFEMFKSV